MNLRPTIFIVKESRYGEKRVALVPCDVDQLIQDGFNVLVEDQAGIGAGFSNSDYELIGAKTCHIQPDCIESYRAVFKNVDMIVRVKRPDRERERLEVLAMKPGCKMVGSLDILEKNSEHLNEYRNADIDYYSFDQFYYSPNTPMDAIKKMSSFAGRLALEDASKKINRVVENVVIIGYGEAGQAAYAECLSRGWRCTVITSEYHKVALIQSQGGNALYLSRKISLPLRQEQIKHIINNVDIVITTASSNGVLAPILIPNKTLCTMKPGTVIVDLAVSEGGNVVGSRSDNTLILGNNILVTNVSGYPKIVPVQASVEWSKASYYFINMLVKTPDLLKRREGMSPF